MLDKDRTEELWKAFLKEREQWVPIDLIRVDTEKYQRYGAKKTVKSVASGLDFDLFGRVWLALREDGFFYATEGGSRVVGLKRRGYKGAVPCYLSSSEGTRKEAKDFLNINESRTKLSAFDIYRAALHAEEKWAVDISEALAANDLTMFGGKTTANSKNVACTNTLRRIWNVGRGDHIRKVVSLACAFFPGDNRIFQGKLLNSVHAVVQSMGANGVPVEETLLRAMERVTFEGFMVLVLQTQKEAKGALGDTEAAIKTFRVLYNRTVAKSAQWK